MHRSIKKMKKVPNGLHFLISELRKDAPVSIWLPSYDNYDYDLLTLFLKKECNVFNDSVLTSRLTNSFPIIIKIIREILDNDKNEYLSDSICNIFISMIHLREDVNKLSRERAVKRTKPTMDYKPCMAECYPNNPIHTMENQYEADLSKDKTEDSPCTKVCSIMINLYHKFFICY